MVDFPLTDFLIGGYTELIGSHFWAFLLFLMVGAVYARTRSFGPTYMVMAVGAFILRAAMPGGVIDGILFFSVVTGIAWSAYHFLKGRI